MRKSPRSSLRRDALGFMACAMVLAILGECCMFAMPGKSFSGPLPRLTPPQRQLSQKLRGDVVLFAEQIGERNVWHPQSYRRAAEEIERRFTTAGYRVDRHTFQADDQPCVNIEATLPVAARPEEIVIIAAHYDSVHGTVGANDNATGVAALLAIAESLKDSRPHRTLRFVAFANEEPPFFHTELMGSVVYARQCRARGENITAMVSLDGLGYYSDEEGSQDYPPPLNLLYPTTGNFIGFVGNIGSLSLVKRCVGSFRGHAQFPSEGGVAPELVTGVGWSDHWSFWQAGYSAIMVTDSLPFRYPHYHTERDTPDKIDYDRLARVVEGLIGMTAELAGAE